VTDELATKRVLCTAASGPFAQLLAIGLPALRAYARKYRFDLMAVTRADAYGRPPAWGKVPIIYQLLDSYGVVVWIDADAAIVDTSRNIADELAPGKDLYLVEHRGFTGDGELVTANTGVMMLRSGAWSKRLLETAWAVREDLIYHRWWENAAMLELLGYRVDPQPSQHERVTEWFVRTHLLDVEWNSMPHFCASPTPLINHYAGLPLAERKARMLADVAATA
jgi:hypothetical protein